MLNRKALISATLATTLAVSGLAAAVPAFAAEAAAPASKFSITVNADFAVQLKAFNDLKALFTATPDMADIKAQYIAKLQASVKAIDPAIDEQISTVLTMAVEGTLQPAQAKQALDKGLQWYFYNVTKAQIGTKAKAALEKGDVAAAKAELEVAIQAYEGALQGTVTKRDAKFGTKIQDLIDSVVIPALQADVENKDVLSFNLHRQMFDKSLIKVFLLATLTYAEVTPGKAPADQPAAMTEGYFFFQPIYGSLKGGSAVDADFVLNTFKNGDVSKVNLVQIKAALARAVEAKNSTYAKKTLESMAKNDLASAQVTAIEGNMFLAALETLIVEALGADAYNAATAEGELYLQAVAAGDIAAAELHSFNILRTLSQLSGVSLKIGTPSITVNNKTTEVDAAPFIHPETSRTLVPARFIAEALGATVDWVEATRTVVIEKDGVKTELTIGGDTVIQGGKAVESLKLDQPALLHGERTFVPLRAIAELFGNKVFYVNGEIVIVK